MRKRGLAILERTLREKSSHSKGESELQSKWGFLSLSKAFIGMWETS